MSQSSQMQSGPPYPLKVAEPDGHPTVGVDIPILAVYLVLYLGGAISHMTIFQINRRRGHKFIMSLAIFGFCMSRIVTCSLRIAWTADFSYVNLAIASEIFTNAGVIIIYVAALLLCLRLFRATHPDLGWNKILGIGIKIMFLFLFLAISLIISFTVFSYYTLNPTQLMDALSLRRTGITLIIFVNGVSLVLFLLSVLLPLASNSENFGEGTLKTKALVLGFVMFFNLFIAGYRTGIVWSAPRPATKPAWYDSREAFYIIELGLEFVIIYFLAGIRFDKLFWVPNGSKGPGDYSRTIDLADLNDLESMDEEKARSSSEGSIRSEI